MAEYDNNPYSVIEGHLKIRHAKKWKDRYIIIRKSSPISDQLKLYRFKKKPEDCCKKQNNEEPFILQDFYGLDYGFELDREINVISIICGNIKEAIVLAFSNAEQAIEWQVVIRTHLGAEKSFNNLRLVNVQPTSTNHNSLLLSSNLRKLPKKIPLKLYINNEKFALTSSHQPANLYTTFELTHVKRFGVPVGSENIFVFRTGSRCLLGDCIFQFKTSDAKRITEHFSNIVEGKLHHRENNRRFPSTSSKISLQSITRRQQSFNASSPTLNSSSSSPISPSACSLPERNFGYSISGSSPQTFQNIDRREISCIDPSAFGYDKAPLARPVLYNEQKESTEDIPSVNVDKLLEEGEDEDNTQFRSSSPINDDSSSNFLNFTDSSSININNSVNLTPDHRRSLSENNTPLYLNLNGSSLNDMSPLSIFSKSLPISSRRNRSKKQIDDSLNCIDESTCLGNEKQVSISQRNSIQYSSKIASTILKMKNFKRKSFNSLSNSLKLSSKNSQSTDEGLDAFRIEKPPTSFKYEQSPIYKRQFFSDSTDYKLQTTTKINVHKPKSLPDLHKTIILEPTKPLPLVNELFHNQKPIFKKPPTPLQIPRVKKTVYQNVPLTIEQLSVLGKEKKCYENMTGDVLEWVLNANRNSQSTTSNNNEYIRSILAAGASAAENPRTPSDSGVESASQYVNIDSSSEDRSDSGCNKRVNALPISNLSPIPHSPPEINGDDEIANAHSKCSSLDSGNVCDEYTTPLAIVNHYENLNNMVNVSPARQRNAPACSAGDNYFVMNSNSSYSPMNSSHGDERDAYVVCPDLKSISQNNGYFTMNPIVSNNDITSQYMSMGPVKTELSPDTIKGDSSNYSLDTLKNCTLPSTESNNAVVEQIDQSKQNSNVVSLRRRESIHKRLSKFFRKLPKNRNTDSEKYKSEEILNNTFTASAIPRSLIRRASVEGLSTFDNLRSSSEISFDKITEESSKLFCSSSATIKVSTDRLQESDDTDTLSSKTSNSKQKTYSLRKISAPASLMSTRNRIRNLPANLDIQSPPPLPPKPNNTKPPIIRPNNLGNNTNNVTSSLNAIRRRDTFKSSNTNSKETITSNKSFDQIDFRYSSSTSQSKPKHGFEYFKPLNKGSPATPSSHCSTVFTFDESMSSSTDGGGCGIDSPRSPKNKQIQHDYVNMAISRMIPIEQVNPTLNYAEIDFSKSNRQSSSKATSSVTGSTLGAHSNKTNMESVPYAVIDIPATQAASEVNKARHLQREHMAGPLRRTNSAKRGSSESMRRVKERKSSNSSFRDRQDSSSSQKSNKKLPPSMAPLS